MLEDNIQKQTERGTKWLGKKIYLSTVQGVQDAVK